MAEGDERQKPENGTTGEPAGGGPTRRRSRGRGRGTGTSRQGGAGREGRAGTRQTGGAGREGRAGGTGQGGGAAGGRRRPDGEGGNGERQPRRVPHAMRLEVGGHGVELHCDTCDLVVTHLAAPQVRGTVEAVHRRHLGTLTWASAWVAVCTCGWRTGRLSQQQAREQLDEHEVSVLLPAARGEQPPPPGGPPRPGGPPPRE